MSPLRIACLLSIALLLGGCARFEPGRKESRGPRAVAGSLDLSAWDFARDGAVDLSGEWLFLPGALVGGGDAGSDARWRPRSVPDVWQKDEAGGSGGKGAGTYRLSILLPPNCPRLAVRNHSGMTAFELEANGAIVARAGRPSLDPALAVSAYKPGVSPLEQISGPLELLLRTSNHEYRAGGIWQPLELGSFAALDARQRLDFHASIVISVAIASVSCGFFVSFLYRRKEKSFLFATLLGLAAALRPIVTGEYALAAAFPSMSFSLLVRLEYASAILSVPAAISLLQSLFPKSPPRRWHAALALPFAPYALAIAALPLYWLTWSIFAFYVLAFVELGGVAALVLARAATSRTPGGILMLTACCLVLLAGANDLLNSSGLIRSRSLIDLALFAFIFLVSVTLSQRFTLAFDEAEELSAQLARSNEALKGEVMSGDEARRKLEVLLAEKEMLLKEVHHRVKNSLQIVSSIVALQANRSTDSSVIAMSRGIRDRIRAISMVHERLYNLDSGERLDLGEYARDLIRLNAESLGPREKPFAAKVEAVAVYADSGFCLDFGLVLTELLSNAMKHAPVSGSGGGVLVRIDLEGDAVRLEVRDEGPGFAEGFDPSRTRTLGFRIVQSLLEKRSGSLEIAPGPGGRVLCRMPIPAPASASPKPPSGSPA